MKYKQGIRFNYISLTYQDGEANQYQWQLKGFDDQWHSVETKPRRYSLRCRRETIPFDPLVECRRRVECRLCLRELPGAASFYLTWWFITGVILVVVSVWSMLLPLPAEAGAGARKKLGHGSPPTCMMISALPQQHLILQRGG